MNEVSRGKMPDFGSMQSQTASLSWYDHPVCRCGIDNFWYAVRDSVRWSGIQAPDDLDRSTPVRNSGVTPDCWLLSAAVSICLPTPEAV